MTVADFQRAQDSMFANMRRMVEGIVAKGQTGGASAPPAGATGTPAASGSEPMTMSTLQRELDRRDELTRAIAGVQISPGQLGLMQRMFQLEHPDDPTGWARTFLSNLGLGGTPGAGGAAAAQPNHQAPSGPPASDGGAPAAPAHSLEGVSLFAMSETDRAHLIREKGLDWYRKTMMEQSKGITVKLR